MIYRLNEKFEQGVLLLLVFFYFGLLCLVAYAVHYKNMQDNVEIRNREQVNPLNSKTFFWKRSNPIDVA